MALDSITSFVSKFDQAGLSLEKQTSPEATSNDVQINFAGNPNNYALTSRADQNSTKLSAALESPARCLF